MKDFTTAGRDPLDEPRFAVDPKTLPTRGAEAGRCSTAAMRPPDHGKPVFSVKYHPEASPGPEDSHYLFERFVNLMRVRKGQPPKPER